LYNYFQKEEPDGEEFEWRSIYDFQNGCHVTAVSWSPETSFMTRVIKVASLYMYIYTCKLIFHIYFDIQMYLAFYSLQIYMSHNSDMLS